MRRILFIIAIVCMVTIVSADTIVIYPDVDGYVSESTDAVWQTIRDDTGDGAGSGSTTTVTGPQLYAAATPDVYTSMRRGILSFNTSDIPDDATVDSAVFSLRCTAKQNGVGASPFGITGGALASNTSIANGDYDGFSGTRYATDIAYADILTTGRNNWTFNANGISAISKTKNTIVFVRDSWDIDNSFGGTWSNGGQTFIIWRPVGYATVGDRPFLEIVYTPAAGGDTTPPDSITNLDNSTSCSYINWSWTNPTTFDFNYTYILKDNAFHSNVSNTTTFQNWTGLVASRSYTISTKTVDITGNMNATWVNKSSVTLVCAETGTTSGGDEASGFILGVTGGLIGSLIIFRKGGKT